VRLHDTEWTAKIQFKQQKGSSTSFIGVTLTLSTPLCSSGQSSWLQIQRSGFVSRYQIFWEVVGLERDPLILVSTIEELHERKSCGSGLENRDYGRKGSAALTTRHPYVRKSWHYLRPSSGRSIGIVARRLKPRSYYYYYDYDYYYYICSDVGLEEVLRRSCDFSYTECTFWAEFEANCISCCIWLEFWFWQRLII
jgi:hypothetical protein